MESPQEINCEKPEITTKKTNKIVTLLTKLGIPLKYIDHKTLLCLHNEGCLENIIRAAANSFKYGYLIRMVISLIGALIEVKTKKNGFNFSILIHMIPYLQNFPDFACNNCKTKLDFRSFSFSLSHNQ